MGGGYGYSRRLKALSWRSTDFWSSDLWDGREVDSVRLLCRGLRVAGLGEACVGWGVDGVGVGGSGWCGNGCEGLAGELGSPGGVVIFVLEFSGVIRLSNGQSLGRRFVTKAPLSEPVNLLS